MKNLKNNIVLATLLLIATIGYSQSENSDEKLLHHVLLFQWSEGHNVDDKAEMLNLFTGLPSKVDGLESFEIIKVANSSGDFDNVLIFKLTSEEALKLYLEHPDHVKAAGLGPKLIGGYAQYDYWK